MDPGVTGWRTRQRRKSGDGSMGLGGSSGWRMPNARSRRLENDQGTIRRALRAASGMKPCGAAGKALAQRASKLNDMSPGAPGSLKECLELSVANHRLQVADELRHVLLSTHAIESIFAGTRDLCRSVMRWSSAKMAMRGATAIRPHARARLRRVICHEYMPALVEPVRNLDKMEAVA